MADKKIGNYVHLRKLNYLRYGTNKPSSNQTAKPDFYTMNNNKERIEINLSAIRDELKLNDMKEQDLKTLENSVNLLFSEGKKQGEIMNNNNNLFQQGLSLIREQILKDMQKEFETSLQFIDWNTGNVKSSGSISMTKKMENNLSLPNKIRENKRNRQGRKNYSPGSKLQTVMERYNAAISFFNKYGSSLLSDEKTIEFNKQMKKVAAEIKSAAKTIQSELKTDPDTQIILNTGDFGKVISYATTFSLEDTKRTFSMQTLIKHMNEIIKLLQASYSLKLQKGELLETSAYYASLLPELAYKIANKKANETIENIVKNLMQNNRSEKVGLSQRSSPEIKLDLFDQNIADLISLKGYTKTKNNTLRLQGSVQDKTDIIFGWSLENPSLSNQKFRISAKNVNLAENAFFKKITIVSGSSLLYMIQQADTTLVNHFLNISVERNKEADKKIRMESNGLTETFISRVHKELEAFLILEAFIGTRGEAASIFLVNDNSQHGRIRAFNMSTLLNNLAENMNFFTVKIGDGKISDLVETIKNDYHENGPDDRIAQVLQQIHQKKVSVSFDPKYLDKFKK